jgi:hypothetical protein
VLCKHLRNSAFIQVRDNRRNLGNSAHHDKSTIGQSGDRETVSLSGHPSFKSCTPLGSLVVWRDVQSLQRHFEPNGDHRSGACSPRLRWQRAAAARRFPDYPVPIVRTGADSVREFVMARWGMPTPPRFLEGQKADKGVTNVRDVSSPHRRRWLAIGGRCGVPLNNFSENAPVTFEPVRFALNESRPLAFFAGI